MQKNELGSSSHRDRRFGGIKPGPGGKGPMGERKQGRRCPQALQSSQSTERSKRKGTPVVGQRFRPVGKNSQDVRWVTGHHAWSGFLGACGGGKRGRIPMP